ncbi:phospholipase A2-activating protein [Tanacetum coccineum]
MLPSLCEVLLEMVCHSAIVYSVDAHKSSGLVASGSEDGSAKIWKDGVCVQSIDHPGCVWNVKFLENGDIVTGCSGWRGTCLDCTPG